MGGLMSRNKGQRGEREVIKLLQPIIDKVYGEFGKESVLLERNLMQTAKGGFDIAGLEWLALEVKYQEAEHLNQWWQQTKEQAHVTDRRTGERRLVREPVLIYRRNNVAWGVRMYGILMAGEVRVKAPVNVDIESFKLWFEYRVREELKKGRILEG